MNNLIDKLKKPGLPRSIAELALLALVIFASRSVFGDWNYVPSGSMKPTLVEGDMIYVDKLAYDLKIPFTTLHLAEWDDPIRGEIVVFYSPKDDIRMVKRVIGEPGDTILMRDNRLIINGQPLNYSAPDQQTVSVLNDEEQQIFLFATEQLPGVEHAVMRQPTPTPQSNFGPVTIPAGEYLLLGDNRDRSGDSRFFGLVERERILGQATRVLISWNGDNFYLPRAGRINHLLQ